MNTSKGWVVGGIAVVVVLLAGGIWYQNATMHNDTTPAVAPAQQTQGNLYVGVTDASADINNVSDIQLAIKKVELHSPTKGWVTVASDEKNYKLLSLKASGSTELYAKAAMDADSYDEVRVTMGDAQVVTKDGAMVKAAMPGSEIVMNAAVNIQAGKDAHLKLDFLGDKSLHAAANGKFVFAPVVNEESRSDATVTMSGSDMVMVSGGSTDSSAKVGLDLTGASRENFELATDKTLQVVESAAASGGAAGASAGAGADTTGGASVNAGNGLKFLLGGQTYIGGTGQIEAPISANAGTNASGSAGANANGSAGAGGSGTNGGVTVPPVNTNGGVHVNY